MASPTLTLISVSDITDITVSPPFFIGSDKHHRVEITDGTGNRWWITCHCRDAQGMTGLTDQLVEPEEK